MSDQRVIALLDESDTVINTIVVDDSTPEDFLKSLIDDNDHFVNVKSTEKIDHLKIKPGLGWKRIAPGKYEAPPVVEPESDPS